MHSCNECILVLPSFMLHWLVSPPLSCILHGRAQMFPRDICLRAKVAPDLAPEALSRAGVPLAAIPAALLPARHKQLYSAEKAGKDTQACNPPACGRRQLETWQQHSSGLLHLLFLSFSLHLSPVIPHLVAGMFPSLSPPSLLSKYLSFPPILVLPWLVSLPSLALLGHSPRFIQEVSEMQTLLHEMRTAYTARRAMEGNRHSTTEHQREKWDLPPSHGYVLLFSTGM